MEIPKAGSTIQINSLKHNKQLHRRWKENIVLYADDQLIIGGNNKTIVEESTGRRWRTTEPALFYFNNQQWFNVIIIFGDTKSYYYCNLSSPYTYKNKSLQYIDYDIDVIVKPSWVYEIVDLDEYDTNKQLYNYPRHIQHSIEMNLNILQSLIENNRDPFNTMFIDYWFKQFLQK